MQMHTKFGKSILGKIIKIVATGCRVLKIKCTKFDFGLGSAPDPAGGAYSATPDPVAWFKGAYFWGRGGRNGRGPVSKVRGRGNAGKLLPVAEGDGRPWVMPTISADRMITHYRVSQKSEPVNILQQQPQICSDLNKILHTQDDICYKLDFTEIWIFK